MTVEEAIETVRNAGSVELIGGAIRYEIRRRSPGVTEALATLKAHKPEALECLSSRTATPTVGSLEAALKGRSIELWSDAAGRLFLVADDEDVTAVTERYGARRGEVYTAGEMRRIVAVNDPKVVAEIHEWKRRFNGKVSDYRKAGR